METQSVRINKKLLGRIRKLVKTSKQPVSAFIDLILDWKVTQLEQEEQVLGEMLMPPDPKLAKWITKKQNDDLRSKTGRKR